jgi:hypothetical protein
MRVLLALALAAIVVAGGAYSVLQSVEHPAAESTYNAVTTGAASRTDWSGRTNVGFDE